MANRLKLIQPSAFGTLSGRRDGAFAARGVTPPPDPAHVFLMCGEKDAAFVCGKRSATFSGGGQRSAKFKGGGR